MLELNFLVKVAAPVNRIKASPGSVRGPKDGRSHCKLQNKKNLTGLPSPKQCSSIFKVTMGIHKRVMNYFPILPPSITGLKSRQVIWLIATYLWYDSGIFMLQALL